MVNYGAIILIIAVAVFFLAGGKNLLQNAFASLQNSSSQPTPQTGVTPNPNTLTTTTTTNTAPPTDVITPITKTGTDLNSSQPPVIETAVIGGTAPAPSSIKTIVNPITIKNQSIVSGTVKTSAGTFPIGGGASPQVKANLPLFNALLSGETESQALGAPTLTRGSQQETDALAQQASIAAKDFNSFSNASFALGGKTVDQLTAAQKKALGIVAA